HTLTQILRVLYPTEGFISLALEALELLGQCSRSGTDAFHQPLERLDLGSRGVALVGRRFDPSLEFGDVLARQLAFELLCRIFGSLRTCPFGFELLREPLNFVLCPLNLALGALTLLDHFGVLGLVRAFGG